VIQSITQAISKYDSTKAIPRYYQDALVALSLLKNGYFSIAKKLALETALEDNKYILPYQILAYTHFLTNNREAANDYFLKLADVDISNKDLYKFLIGISFYRSKEYDQSILYLSQVNDTGLQTDTYRYLLLSYGAENDTKSMTQVRQKLLGQQDLPAGQEGMTESDYYDYFYQGFYKPYSINEKSQIYEENKLLAEMYVTNCATTFTGANSDICTYGEMGLDLYKDKNALSLGRLSALAGTYNESYLFSIIGDLYRLQNNLAEAKKSYAQALSLSTDSREQDILKSKISQITD
jgi:tetratricopeptide (TPR) repeat protein